MIDYVHLGTDIEIPEEEFDWSRFRTGILKDGTVVWYHRFRGVWVRYYPMRQRITVTGKILMLLEDSEVLNVDDVYRLDIPQFVRDINDYLGSSVQDHSPRHPVFSRLSNRLLLQCLYAPCRRVRPFYERCFRQVDNGRESTTRCTSISTEASTSRRNPITVTTSVEITSSISTTRPDRLKYLHDRKYKISTRDFEFAQDNLRLEVQCGFLFIKRLCKKYRIQPLFGNLLDYEIAYYAEKSIYKLIFRSDDTQDYYTYSEAKKCLPRSEATAHTLRTASQGHKIIDSKYNYGRELIKKTGVFPFCFLPRDGKLTMLENPLKLIQRKLEDIGVDMSLL